MNTHRDSKFSFLILLFSVLAISGAPVAAPPSVAARAATAALDVGSDGSDGPLNPTQDIEIDLATMGTYDPVHWAVVFNYTMIDIPLGVIVTFKNHPTRAPVVWLSQGDVNIDGTVDVSAHDARTWLEYAEPGPGGFRGAVGKLTASGWSSSSGFGPGGGFQRQTNPSNGLAHIGGGAGHASSGGSGQGAAGSPYGNPSVSQLIGGSGGAAERVDTGINRPGGSGGGAILIASNGTVTVGGGGGGRIYANGGGAASGFAVSGYGSGGAIRLLANSVTVNTSVFITATQGGGGGGFGSAGRIRIEANTCNLLTNTSPPASVGTPGEVFATGAPKIRVSAIGGVPVGADPLAGFGLAGVPGDVSIPLSGLTTVVIETNNVPLNSTVLLRVTGARGAAFEVTVANPLVATGGPDLEATTSVDVDLSDGYTSLLARAVLGS